MVRQLLKAQAPDGETQGKHHRQSDCGVGFRSIHTDPHRRQINQAFRH
jgi:hypothetical protein